METVHLSKALVFYVMINVSALEKEINKVRGALLQLSGRKIYPQ